MAIIILIGPPGSGKTTVGKRLAELLSCAFLDTDALIVSRQGKPIKEIFRTDGEWYFRQLESEIIDEISRVKSHQNKLVVATGGGLPIYNNNLEKLKQLGATVSLTAGVSELVNRLTDNRERPLLPDKSDQRSLTCKLSELMDVRVPLYAQAGYKIDTTGLSPTDIAIQIANLLGHTID